MLIIDVNTSSFNNAATSTSPISTATPNGATFLTGNQLQQQQKIIPSPIYTAVSSSPASSTTTTPVSTPSSTTVTSPPVTNVKKRKNSSISAKKPGIKSTEINSLLGEVWRNMSEEDKKPYLQMRDTALEQYEKDLAFVDLENDVMYQEAVKIARKILDGLETDLNDRWYEYELPTSLNNLTSGNKEIDNVISLSQSQSSSYDGKYLELIEECDVKITNFLCKGGNGSIYEGVWGPGRRCIKDNIKYREANTALENHSKLLNSDKIITIYGVAIIKNEFTLVMEYAQNGSLQNFLKNNYHKLIWKQKISIICDIAEALEQINNLKYIHGDLHSGNVLISDNQTAKISDFGSSSAYNDQQSRENLSCTIPYTAPEVFMTGYYSENCDTYSLGVIMSEISSGQQPFPNENHDRQLALDICLNNKRPVFANNTPKFIIEMASKCMDGAASKRPTIKEIREKLYLYKCCFDESSILNINGDFTNEEVESMKKFKILILNLIFFDNQAWDSNQIGLTIPSKLHPRSNPKTTFPLLH
ncbi:21354_t:CDS:2 [Entrophospora sp. SA101]|nr:17915_t:CDS:2 [Entrophospora sp. SA101]CAJ0764546.1 21354_t:CDS:2 [Entrophospora sp. SA101]